MSRAVRRRAGRRRAGATYLGPARAERVHGVHGRRALTERWGAPAETAEVDAAFVNAFGRPSHGWSAGPVAPDAVAGATKGLYRVRSADRSLILKVITSEPRGHPRWLASTEPAHPYYWKREALVYASGVSGTLHDSLRAPRCFGIFDRSEDEVAVWLEDVRGEPATRWSVERYGLAARHLGRAQGRFAAGVALPPEGWWSRGWLREYLARHVPGVAAESAAIPSELFTATRKLWDESEWFLSMLDSVPRTLSHLDAWTLNLFADEADATVLIDWAYAGSGALGEDVGNMFPDAFFDGFVPPSWLPEMERRIFDGYLAGIRDAGAAVEADVLRLSFAAAAAVKYVWMIPHLSRMTEDPAADRKDVERLVRIRVPVMMRLFELADEARGLARAFGL